MIPIAFQDYYKFEVSKRFSSFLRARFSGSENKLREESKRILISNSPFIAGMRELFDKIGEGSIPDYSPEEEGIIVAQAYSDKIMYNINQEK
ncbi:peptidoglycan binding domain protein [Oceanobacillus picturae]|uniref:Peptidoglycan binding domain protein n=1 Tax=Oceanobacillus picturae TaxID=171693 RepID=A0A0U9I2I2_9BACI|nr:hypothetical protein [Oceanobacillus picturae]GAQ19933.1 peptidoglycan binding domain protein [Oceanobacillus picturae]